MAVQRPIDYQPCHALGCRRSLTDQQQLHLFPMPMLPVHTKTLWGAHKVLRVAQAEAGRAVVPDPGTGPYSFFTAGRDLPVGQVF